MRLSKKRENIIQVLENKAKYFESIQQKTIFMLILGGMLFSIPVFLIIYDNIYLGEEIQKESGFAILGKQIDDLENKNIQNFSIDTWMTWKIKHGEDFYIQILNSSEVTPERISVINEVLFSNEKINVDGKMYDSSWKSVLERASSLSELSIPSNYKIIVSDIDTGQITIRLTNNPNPDGYSGFTSFQIDMVNNQIIKSKITIYSVDKISTEDLKIILRHELGHAFGLAHSDNPDDLMYYKITTNYPYMSECDTLGIIWLYNGHKKSSIDCNV